MKFNYLCIFFILFLTASLSGQEEEQSVWDADNFKGLEFRGIGPALMSGRIADIAIHPEDGNTWYIAVGSGGVWKTVNAGVTFEPIFDEQGSYSIGCVTVDPHNPHRVWVGTGENVGGRHVGYGDGVYLSEDGGKSWTNMGLKNSDHISKIIVHPEDINTVWVASQGPLWSPGGDRGVYKTTDGGQTWKRTIGDDEWIGATDLLIDPRNPDRLYVATWEHHRNVAAYMGSGPGTGIYRSEDGGDTWKKLKTGLPDSHMGKIGLGISPMQPDVLYAAIELERRTGGVYRSADRGETWEKRSDMVAGGTGPHYYQELYVSPHSFDRIYHANNSMMVSDDGGLTFRVMSKDHKHGDDHALAFRMDDPDYLLCGSDGGVYESFDLAKNWRFMENLPLTQFYKLALDDAEPFYNIYGGTQDNSTEGGPSRTDNAQGIQNSDWRVVLNWDGHQPATEPGNPNIMYGQRQQGFLARIDLTTGEVVDIQPQAGDGEKHERYNWDAPILVSPHDPKQIFFGSYRLWKSNDRGDNWEAVSGDLTRDQERFELPVMGRQQSWDNSWDFLAMSTFNTITSISESPVQRDLIYIGTDDGLMHITEDGGQNWRKIEVGSLPGVPSGIYVNDIKADLHDANKVYAIFDNHKYGDYKPYVYVSMDKGQTWKSISSNLPDREIVWRIVQDHVKPELMFIGTEFGIYFTPNGGEKWVKLKGGLPIISFRDLAIQKRENDLVGASFGRSFYVFDDYSPLREVDEAALNAEATLFDTRKAWWYIPRSYLSFDEEKGTQGADHFVAPNPPFGAVFTYYLKDGYKTLEAERKELEKELNENRADIEFPGWDKLEDEETEKDPSVLLVVSNQNGDVIRRIKGPATAGFHRIAWDLRYPSSDFISLDDGLLSSEPMAGFLAPPGTYEVQLFKVVRGKTEPLSESREFSVIPLREGALEGSSFAEADAFWRRLESTSAEASALSHTLSKQITKAKAMERALGHSGIQAGELDNEISDYRNELIELDSKLNGNIAKRGPSERDVLTIGQRIWAVSRAVSQSTYGPTASASKNLDIAEKQMEDLKVDLDNLIKRGNQISDKLESMGAPRVEE